MQQDGVSTQIWVWGLSRVMQNILNTHYTEPS